MRSQDETRIAFRDRLTALLIRGYGLADTISREAAAQAAKHEQHNLNMIAARIGGGMTEALRDAYKLVDEMYEFIAQPESQPVKPAPQPQRGK